MPSPINKKENMINLKRKKNPLKSFKKLVSSRSYTSGTRLIAPNPDAPLMTAKSGRKRVIGKLKMIKIG